MLVGHPLRDASIEIRLNLKKVHERAHDRYDVQSAHQGLDFYQRWDFTVHCLYNYLDSSCPFFLWEPPAELNHMPNTVPTVVGSYDLLKFGQSSANSRIICSHGLLYDCRNSSHQLLQQGATIGTSSNWRRTNLEGILQSSFANVFTLLPTMSKIWTKLHAPNIC